MRWSRYNLLFRSERYGRLLHNSLSNTLLELDDAHYHVLEGLQTGSVYCGAGAARDEDDFLALLREAKVLVEDGEEVRLLLARQYRRHALCFDTSHFGLTICPTLRCNFRCPYCFEHSQRDGSVMSPETVARLLTFVKGHEGARHLSIAWYGGEPMLAFDLICDITEKVRALDLGFEGAGLVTNGYLLDGGKIARLNELSIKSIQITLDGPKEVHDTRRVLAGGNPTFERILGNVESLMDSSYAGSCAIRVNIDRHNIESFLDLRTELLERFGGKDLSVYPGHVNTSLSHAYDHACNLGLPEWADFTFATYRDGGAIPRGGFYPADDRESICGATTHYSWVVGPDGELYKCWEDVGNPEMVVGDIHQEEPVTNPELIAMYGTGTDPYSDPACRACSVLPICGGGCANLRLRAKHFGELGLEFCSPYRDNLIPYLEAYYDTFRSMEICDAVLGPGRQKGEGRGYRVVSPEKKADGLRGTEASGTEADPRLGPTGSRTSAP